MKNYFNYEKVKQGLKNPKVKSPIVLSAGLITLLFMFWFVGLFRTPRHYRPVESVADGNISQYLTNYILPELHNKSQYGQPFDLVVSETGINDIIARHVDLNSLRQAGLSNLSVVFKPGRILLTGKAVYCGFDFIVTIVLKPYIDKEGQFFLGVSKVQVGNSRVPFVAETLKRKVLEGLDGFSNSSDVTDFVKVLFNNGRIEPMFSINHKKLNVEKITTQDKELIIRFLPEQGK
jgi:uncharacterized protein YpmS